MTDNQSSPKTQAPSARGKVYSAEALALFERYIPARADHRPKGCTGGEMCWVEKGPPAMGKIPGVKTACLGCRQSLGGKPGRPRKGLW